MCTTCGCGDTELVPVELHDKILAGNDRQAAHNREHFQAHGVLALNLMGSPGAGKTAVLEATSRFAEGKLRLSAVSADLATDNDARRLQKAGTRTSSSSRTWAISSARPSTTSARRPTWWRSR